jgi:integrase
LYDMWQHGRFINNPTCFNTNPKCQNEPTLPVIIQMKKDGYEESTLIGTSRRLRNLDIHTDLSNPESVMQFIMNKNASNGYKNNLQIAYLNFAHFYKIDFRIRLLRHKSKHIRIPTTEELNSLINSAHNPLSLKLRLLKETGLRPIELVMLKTNDIDIEKKVIYPTTVKNGSARTLRISNALASLLQTYIKNDRNLNSLLFNTKINALRTKFPLKSPDWRP